MGQEDARGVSPSENVFVVFAEMASVVGEMKKILHSDLEGCVLKAAIDMAERQQQKEASDE